MTRIRDSDTSRAVTLVTMTTASQCDSVADSEPRLSSTGVSPAEHAAGRPSLAVTVIAGSPPLADRETPLHWQASLSAAATASRGAGGPGAGAAGCRGLRRRARESPGAPSESDPAGHRDRR